MNSRLERLKATIAKCEKVDEVFTKQGVCGAEPEFYDDLVAGRDTPARSTFLLGWDLIFETTNFQKSSVEKRKGREPTRIEVVLYGGRKTDPVIIVSYFPAIRTWVGAGMIVADSDVSAAVHALVADCRLSPGESRQISEAEAMKIIATLAAFYKSQPAG